VLAPSDVIRVGATLTDSAVTTYHEYPGSLANPWPADKKLRWWTSDPSIASIDTGSLLAAHRAGRVVVWVAVGTVEDSGTVVVGAGSGGTATPYRAVAGGLGHSCALAVDGAAYCWGFDFNGALGQGRFRQFTRVAIPGRVSGGHAFDALAVGGNHSCGLTAAGAAYCWGGNQYGQLGDSTDPAAFTMIGAFGRPAPVSVSGAHVFRLVAAAGNHTCALDGAGRAFCWGWHAFGQLGIGGAATAFEVTPTPVAGDLRFRSLGLGSLHSCGVTTDSVTYCWGFNDRAQLGIDALETPRVCTGNQRCVASPIAIDSAHRFTSVVAGRTHTCALTSAGAAYCWGNGSPVFVLASGPPFVSLVAGTSHTCGLTAAGAAYCWGSNGDGQLGIGPIGGEVPSPVAVSTSIAFVALGAGSAHTCGIDRDGQAYCWGQNGHGEVGNGTVQAPNAVHRAMVPVPVRVLDPLQ